MQNVLKDAMIGSLVDQYHIEKQLGEGGCGDVFLATDVKMAKKVALKFVQPNPGMETSKIHERFYREIQALVKMNHPNVIQVFDYNMNGFEGPYYVMEYLEGQDLEEYLLTHGAFSPAQVYSICQQLCSALHAIHERDMVFRDLKTANVFVTETSTYEHVKLLDFGLALSSQDERMTKQGCIVGTPYFMAPEQIMNTAKVTFRADIYSFGVLLFRLLTAAYPYKGGNRTEMLRQHCMGQPDLDHPAVWPRMQEFLDVLLDKNPKKRPSSMFEVWCGLESVLLEQMQRSGGVGSQAYLAAFRETQEAAPIIPEANTTPAGGRAFRAATGMPPPLVSEDTTEPEAPAPGDSSGESLFLEFSPPDWWGERG